MMLRTLGLALMLMAAPASAAKILKNVPGQLASDMAYVLVEVRNHDGGAAPGTIVLARYDPVKGDVRGGTRSPDTALPKGSTTRIAVANKALVKTKKSRLYLVELEPDTWVVEGASGTAFSLGSNSFELARGTVTDLGVVAPKTDWREGDGPPSMGNIIGQAMLGVFAKKSQPTPAMAEVARRESGDIALPEPLKSKALPVQFTAGSKFGNYLNGLINRIEGRKGRASNSDVSR